MSLLKVLYALIATRPYLFRMSLGVLSELQPRSACPLDPLKVLTRPYFSVVILRRLRMSLRTLSEPLICQYYLSSYTSVIIASYVQPRLNHGKFRQSPIGFLGRSVFGTK